MFKILIIDDEIKKIHHLVSAISDFLNHTIKDQPEDFSGILTTISRSKDSKEQLIQELKKILPRRNMSFLSQFESFINQDKSVLNKNIAIAYLSDYVHHLIEQIHGLELIFTENDNKTEIDEITDVTKFLERETKNYAPDIIFIDMEMADSLDTLLDDQTGTNTATNKDGIITGALYHKVVLKKRYPNALSFAHTQYQYEERYHDALDDYENKAHLKGKLDLSDRKSFIKYPRYNNAKEKEDVFKWDLKFKNILKAKCMDLLSIVSNYDQTLLFDLLKGIPNEFVSSNVQKAMLSGLDLKINEKRTIRLDHLFMGWRLWLVPVPTTHEISNNRNEAAYNSDEDDMELVYGELNNGVFTPLEEIISSIIHPFLSVTYSSARLFQSGKILLFSHFNVGNGIDVEIDSTEELQKFSYFIRQYSSIQAYKRPFNGERIKLEEVLEMIGKELDTENLSKENLRRLRQTWRFKDSQDYFRGRWHIRKMYDDDRTLFVPVINFFQSRFRNLLDIETGNLKSPNEFISYWSFELADHKLNKALKLPMYNVWDSHFYWVLKRTDSRSESFSDMEVPDAINQFFNQDSRDENNLTFDSFGKIFTINLRHSRAQELSKLKFYEYPNANKRETRSFEQVFPFYRESNHLKLEGVFQDVGYYYVFRMPSIYSDS